MTITLHGTNGITLSDGDIALPNGHGISFAAQGPDAGGVTSELLTDYEIGTWTPTSFAGTLSGTSPVLTGRYLKIGDFVTVRLNISNTAGDLQVSSYVGFGGVPYTFTNNAQGVVLTEDIDIFARQGFASCSSSYFYLSACGSSSGTVALTATVSGRITN